MPTKPSYFKKSKSLQLNIMIYHCFQKNATLPCTEKRCDEYQNIIAVFLLRKSESTRFIFVKQKLKFSTGSISPDPYPSYFLCVGKKIENKSSLRSERRF